MTVRELMELLVQLDPGQEVRVAYQPRWPLRATVAGVLRGDDLPADEREGAPDAAEFAWLAIRPERPSRGARAEIGGPMKREYTPEEARYALAHLRYRAEARGTDPNPKRLSYWGVTQAQADRIDREVDGLIEKIKEQP